MKVKDATGMHFHFSFPWAHFADFTRRKTPASSAASLDKRNTFSSSSNDSYAPISGEDTNSLTHSHLLMILVSVLI